MLDGALTIGGRGTENIQWESAHTASTRRTDRGISRYVARYLGFGVARRAAKRQLSTLNSQLSVTLPQPTRELHPALRVLPRAPSLSVHRPLGLALFLLLALAFNSQLSTAFAANVHFKRIYPIGGAPNTNVFRIQACSSNILADGTPMQVLGNPVRVQPDTNGDVTVTNLQINWYQNLDDQYIFQVYDSSSTLYDVTNLLQSGYNLFIVRNYGSNNAAVTFTTVTNALGYTPANQTNLLYTSNILAGANQAFGANETNLVTAVSNALATATQTFGANGTNNTTAVSNILAAATTAARTNTLYTSNILAASVAATYYPLTNPSNYITATITNSLASTNYVQTSVSASNYVTKTQVSATNALALAAATNAAATQGNASTNFTLLIGTNGTNNTTAVSNILAAATAAARTNTLYTSNILAALNATFGANDTNNVTAVSNILAAANQTFGANGTNNVTAVSNILAAATAAARTNTLYTSNILAVLNATFGANDTNNVTAVSNILAAATSAARTNTLYTSNVLAAATAISNATLSAAIGLAVTNTQRTVTLGGLSLLDLGVNYWSGTLPGIFGSGAWLGFDTNATTLRIGYIDAGSSIALNAQSGRITALTFSGDGSALTGLTNLPVAAITNLPPTLTALSNQIAWVQSQIGCDTNFLLITSAGVANVNGTNVWSGNAWTNLNGNAYVSNSIFYASGIAAYGGAYPTTGTTNLNGFNPQPVARFFPKTNAAGSNITITRSYGVDTIASTGGSGGSATNVSTTNLVGYVGGVLTQGLTNLIFSAAGTNAILSIIPAAAGVTNATLQAYTTNTVINVNSYVTNNVADQLGLAAALSQAATNPFAISSGLAARVSTNRFLLSGPLGNNDGILIFNLQGTNLINGSVSSNAFDAGTLAKLYATSSGGGTNDAVLQLSNNPSVKLVGGTLNTNADTVNNLIAGGTGNILASANQNSGIIEGSQNRGNGNAGSLIVGGNQNNLVSSVNSGIFGGQLNTNNTGTGTILAGGNLNTAFNSQMSAIIGGQLNGLGSTANFSLLGGGRYNTNYLGDFCAIIGGEWNTISSDWSSIYSSGTNNRITGNFGSILSGNNVSVTHNGVTVIADPQATAFNSAATNSLIIREQNGVAINTNDPSGYGLNVNGSLTATNAYFPTATIGDFSSSSLAGADVSSSGNMDAQTYTANGAPITFLTNNITALIASGGTGQAASLNGIYYPNGGNWTNVGAGAGIARSGSTWLMSTSTAAILYKNNGSVIGYYRTNGVVGTNGGMTVAVYSQTTGTFPISQISTNGGNVNQVPTVSASGQVVWTNASGGSTAGAVTTNWFPARTFYVATNGNNATAVIGDSSHPFYPGFSNTVGVCSMATNAGDTIFLLPGTYWAAPTGIPIPAGVTFMGLGQSNVVIIETNNNSALSTFHPLGDNVKIQRLTWSVVPVGGIGNDFGSFLFADGNTNNWTRCVVSDCIIGGNTTNVDVWYSSDPNIVRGATFENCFIGSQWDFASQQSGDTGYIITKNCTFLATEVQSRARFNTVGVQLADFGSSFYGFKTWTNQAAVEAAFSSANILSFNGSQFYITNGFFPLLRTNFNNASYSGSYIDAVRNKTFSLNPERGDYYTNTITTNLNYIYGYSNIYIRLGTQVGVTNNQYKLKGYSTNDYVNGRQTFTNTLDNRFTLELNDPVVVAFYGAGNPITSIESNSVNLFSITDGAALNIIASGYQFDDIQAGSGTAPSFFPETNSVIPVYTYNYLPEIMNGNIKQTAAGGVKYFGDGAGLTNLTGVLRPYSTNATLAAATSLTINFLPFSDNTVNYTVTAPNDLVGVTVTTRTPTNFTLGFTAATLTAQTIEGGVIHK